MSADFNPVLAHSELLHRVTVDRLKWELGQPLPCLAPLPAPALYNPRYYYHYYYGYPYYGYPWAATNQYHYSMGFRDGLKSAGDGGASDAKQQQQPPCPQKQQQQQQQQSRSACSYPGDLAGLPCASYRRPLSPFPVSADTSYDNPVACGWPYGCKPFYFRHADPPSVRYI